MSLRSNLTSEVRASQTIPASNLSTFEYTQLKGSIINTVAAPNTSNTLSVTFNASEVAGSTFHFGLNSLFPETFKGRTNGLRKDLTQNLYDMKPKFLRFPGGSNIEGISLATRFKWNETIGPLINRKG